MASMAVRYVPPASVAPPVDVGEPDGLLPPPHAVATTARIPASANTCRYRFFTRPPSMGGYEKSWRIGSVPALLSLSAYLPLLGSSASRNPSPTRLKASVMNNRNIPGKTIIHQAYVKIWEDEAS